jgi:RNA polymerase sigma-70 factor (ECF subfamily)
VASPPPELSSGGEEPSDDALMRLASEGHLDAFGILVRRYERSVRSCCIRLCRGVAPGEDAAQESFIRVWQSRSRYEARGNFRAYLFRVVHNCCRSRPRSITLIAEWPPELPTREEEGPLGLLLGKQQRRLLEASLMRLPEEQREALILRFSAELDYAAIAEIAGKPEATIRSRVFLGLSRLRRLLGKGTPQ